MRVTKAVLEGRLNTLKQELDRRRLVGAQLANICYNIVQRREFSEYDRDITDGVRQEWDAIKRTEAL